MSCGAQIKWDPIELQPSRPSQKGYLNNPPPLPERVQAALSFPVSSYPCASSQALNTQRSKGQREEIYNPASADLQIGHASPPTCPISSMRP